MSKPGFNKITKEEIIFFLKENKEKFLSDYGIEILALFGSMARGDYNDNSDIDILHKVIIQEKYDPFKLDTYFEQNINRKVDLVSQEFINPAVDLMSKKERIYV